MISHPSDDLLHHGLVLGHVLLQPFEILLCRLLPLLHEVAVEVLDDEDQLCHVDYPAVEPFVVPLGLEDFSQEVVLFPQALDHLEVGIDEEIHGPFELWVEFAGSLVPFEKPFFDLLHLTL